MHIEVEICIMLPEYAIRKSEPRFRAAGVGGTECGRRGHFAPPTARAAEQCDSRHDAMRRTSGRGNLRTKHYFAKVSDIH